MQNETMAEETKKWKQKKKKGRMLLLFLIRLLKTKQNLKEQRGGKMTKRAFFL
jgi:hypothetical protein